MDIFELYKKREELDDLIESEKIKIHQYLFDNGVFDIFYFKGKPISEYAKRDKEINIWKFGTNLSSYISIYEEYVKFDFTECIDGYENDSISLYLNKEELEYPKLMINNVIKEMGKYVSHHISKDKYREIRLKQLL